MLCRTRSEALARWIVAGSKNDFGGIIAVKLLGLMLDMDLEPSTLLPSCRGRGVCCKLLGVCCQVQAQLSPRDTGPPTVARRRGSGLPAGLAVGEAAKTGLLRGEGDACLDGGRREELAAVGDERRVLKGSEGTADTGAPSCKELDGTLAMLGEKLHCDPSPLLKREVVSRLCGAWSEGTEHCRWSEGSEHCRCGLALIIPAPLYTAAASG